MQRQPTLLNSCARAATAAEARYRISYPEFARRSSRVIALDDQAAAIVGRIAGERDRGLVLRRRDHGIDMPIERRTDRGACRCER